MSVSEDRKIFGFTGPHLRPRAFKTIPAPFFSDMFCRLWMAVSVKLV